MTENHDVLLINGGKALAGELPVNRAKNSALYLMLAALLTDEPVVLKDVPRLSDVLISEEILRHVGVTTSWQGPDLHLHAANLTTHHAPYSLVSKTLSRFVNSGSLLVG